MGRWSNKKSVGTRSKQKTPLDLEHEKTWRLCSEYIRKRGVGKNGYGYCVTCYMYSIISKGVLPNTIHRKDGDAGHYVSVVRSNTKYDVLNLSLQCRNCNRMEHGEQHLHGQYLDRIYGDGTADKLQIAKFITKSWTMEELQDLQKFFKEGIQKIHELNERDKRRTVTNAKRRDPNVLFDV